MTGGPMESELVAVSKRLAYVLRHDPASVGLRLDAHGWVEVDALLVALATHGPAVGADLLDHVVATSDKRRFERQGTRIRAAQGHSVPVDLDLPAAVPPAALYHGTVERFLTSIRAEGLRPGRRLQVHLSGDPATAAAVGARRGRPVVLQVDAAAMHRDGYVFRQAANGVWLTADVPPGYLAP